jgi:3-isopropylmalate/(R)-2-methylmalate dehydratase small subunit
VTNPNGIGSTFLNKLLRLSNWKKESFDISDIKKANMINGFDDIDYLQNIKRK